MRVPPPFALARFLLFLLAAFSTYVITLLPFCARKRLLRFHPHNIGRFYRVMPLPSDDGSYKFSYAPMEIPNVCVPALKRDGRWRFSSCLLPCCGRRHIFSYHGELDDEGRPHGIGRWRDSQSRGESLKGLWRHGVPIGPFVAAEQGAGFGFRSVQIAFATCDAKADLWDADGGGGTKVGPLHWGVAATETSINGLYYKHLPKGRLLCGPTAGVNAFWAMEQMTQMRMESEEGTITVGTTGSWREGSTHLVIGGYEPTPSGGVRPTSVTIEAVRSKSSFRHMSSAGVAISAAPRPATVDERLSAGSPPPSPPAPEDAVEDAVDAPAGANAVAKGARSNTVRFNIPAPVETEGSGKGSPLPVRRASIETPPPHPDEEHTFEVEDEQPAAIRRRAPTSIVEETTLPNSAIPRRIELPKLQVVGWRPQDRSEALLFIHGWTAGNKWAHHNLAQFLNLSRLGPHIRPFIFAWPCGLSVLSFPDRSRFADKTTAMHKALATCIKELAEAGIRKLHVFAHSMGARVFCTALPFIEEHLLGGRSSAAHGDLAEASDASARSTPRLKLSTCTLLHPEHDLDTFIQRDYKLLRSVCEVITLYMDRKDNALAWAEVLNRAPSLGKHPFALVSQERAQSRKSVVSYVRGYEMDVDLMITPSAQRPALDVDVIDTSWMDTNAAGPRHAYFNVNRWLIDDLAEVILTRKRAAARPHRLVKLDMEGRTFGNVWVFLAAPSWIGA